jgi:hypothetical protein
VGLEDPADIIDDLAQAIEAAGVVAGEEGLWQAAR